MPAGDLMAQVRVRGLKELNEVFKQFPDRVKRKVLRGALRDAAKPIHTAARNNIPIDSGETRKDLKVRTYRNSEVPRNLGDAAVAVAGSRLKDGRAFIMYFLEFGTKNMPPKPFLRPAVDENEGTTIQVFGRAAWARMTRELQKLKRR